MTDFPAPSSSPPTVDSGSGGRPDASTIWTATWEAGPAAGGSVPLTPGRHLVGRAQAADVRSDDLQLEPFHLLLEVGAGGTVDVTQLAGRTPVRLDGEVLDDGVRLVVADDVHVVEIGSSRLVLRCETARARPVSSGPPSGVGRTARSVVVREPRAVPAWDPVPVEVEQSTSSAASVGFGGLVPALIAFAGSALLAMLLRQPMFLVFGALGAVVAVAGWAVQHVGDRRGRRVGERRVEMEDERFAGALEAQRMARANFHRASTGTLAGAVRIVTGGGPGLWSRRPDHGDAFTVSLGVGDLRWQPVLAEQRVPERHWGAVERVGTLEAVPVPCVLDAGAHVGVQGPHALAVVRSLVVQLAAQAGPADWQLLVVTEHPERWGWTTALPHARDDGGPSARVLDEAAVAAALRDVERLAGRHTVVVTDCADLLATRTGPLRRLLAGELRPACITALGDDGPVPAVCRSVLTTRADGRARWSADVQSGELPVPLHLAGLTEVAAASVAAALADRVDPEDPRSAERELPTSASLVELLDATSADDIAARWNAIGADAPPATPLGIAADGTVEIDLVRDGPHGLLAGTTGAGKSELLRSLVVGLAARLGPDRLTFVLVDYKGGATFDAFAALPHVVGALTDLDAHLAERALRSLRAELSRRERVLRELGAIDLSDARRRTGVPVLPRLVVVIDEFAALAVEHAEFLHSLVGIAQRGRSLGVHLLLATQRPNGVISDDIRANTDLRLALRLQDSADAIDVLGDAGPAMLPRHLPGRAIVRLGATEYVTFQTARCADGDLDALVEAIVAAARMLALPAPARPWLEPLPAVLDGTVLDGAATSPSLAAIGLVDLPDEQRRAPLSWHPADGHLAVIGAPGSGVTSTLIAAVVARLAVDPAAELIVVDALGDPSWDAVDRHPRCRGVVRLHERERLRRALIGLGDPQRRAAGGVPLLVIDGYAALRDELDDLDRDGERDAFERCLADGSGTTATVLIGADGVSVIPAVALSRIPNRWLLHLHDPHDAAAVGVPAALVPPAVPGRLVVVGRQVVAQVVAPATRRLTIASGMVPVERIGTLPSTIDPAELGAGRADEHGMVLPLGRAFDDLRDAALDVPEGEHVLVLGPARSGRSTALLGLIAAWQGVHPTGWLGAVAPRRSPLHGCVSTRRSLEEVLHGLPADGPALLVVDDAELVDDPSGRLGAVLGERRPGLLVVAAARGEALRQTYGHWTSVVRRSRLGVVMAASGELDGDLLGTVLPRRLPIAPRAGLAHLVADGGSTLVQCAYETTMPTRSARPAPSSPSRDAAHLAAVV